MVVRSVGHHSGYPAGMREITVTPDAWLTRGEAVVRGERKSLVVWSGIPGEAGVVGIYREGRNQDRGRWLRPAGKADPRRRKPFCDKYDRCGGCPIMHLEPEAQDDIRLDIVRGLLADKGLAARAPESIVGSPDGGKEYRYVAKMAVGRSEWGRIRLGAYGRDSHDVIPIPKCHVVTSALRVAMAAVAHYVIELDIQPYDAETDKGVLRHVVLRQSRTTGKMLVTLIAGRRPKILNELAECLEAHVPEIAGVHLHLNEDPGNAIFEVTEDGVGSRFLSGDPTIEETLAGIRLDIGPGDFFQANPGVADRLVSDVVELLSDERDRPVVDLYCGVGAFTLALAREHQWAIGIEVVASAVRRARQNATKNRISAEFIAGPVEERISEVAARLKGAAPVVVMDPARRGLEPSVIEAVTNLKPCRLIYVSCNPTALARDLVGFVANGWAIEGIKAYDMFPQTAHLELVVDLRPAVRPTPARGGPRRRIVR